MSPVPLAIAVAPTAAQADAGRLNAANLIELGSAKASSTPPRGGAKGGEMAPSPSV